MKLRLIGDIHTNRKKYLSLIHGAEYSLQVGDLDILGFDWMTEEGVDPEFHKFVGGNHDNYDVIGRSPHHLGDFGVWSIPNFGDIFFVRGAWSIDQKWREFGIDWWPDEELSYQKCEEAIELYKEVKPKILVTHACPSNIIKFVTGPDGALRFGFDRPIINTKTDQMLQAMLDHHLPRLHVFGHYHQYFDGWVNGRLGIELDKDSPVDKQHTADYTRYVCLPEFGTMELDSEKLDL